MGRSPAPKRIAVVGTYPPKRCGLAYFAHDLVTALRAHGATVDIIAVDKGEPPRYGPDVVATMQASDPASFGRAAHVVNRGNYDAIFIQHEFGIFGGSAITAKGLPLGDNLLLFLGKVDASTPVVMTFHTVLPDPEPEHAAMMTKLGTRAACVIAMTQAAARLLRGPRYGLSNVAYIPHGTPTPPGTTKADAKAKLGVGADQHLIVTTGLMHPDHEAGPAIYALEMLRKLGHNVSLHIVGRDHPDVISNGSQHRVGWQQLVDELDLRRLVTFVDQELTTPEVMEYYRAGAIALARGGPGQAASGRVPWAMAAGCAVIGGPSPYNHEVLADGCGAIMPDFYLDDLVRQGREIANLAADLLGNPGRLQSVQAAAAARAAQWSWPIIAQQYLDLIASLGGTSARTVFGLDHHADTRPPVLRGVATSGWPGPSPAARGLRPR